MDSTVREDGFPLLLIGMHRSGTSLLSSWLQKNGVNIGDNLMGAAIGNDNGHFEDLDVVRLHDGWLKKKGLDWCSAVQSVPTTQEMEQGRRYVSEIAKINNVWGWKDPRTCIFLPLWDHLIPHVHYLDVFRESDEVVSSLLRRDKEWFHKVNHDFFQKILHMPRFYLSRLSKKYHYYRTWRIYNECILDFLKIEGVFERTLVLSIDNYLSNSVDVMTFVQREWKYPLGQTDINDLYQAGKLKAETAECIHRVKSLNNAVMKNLINYEHMSLEKLKTLQP